MIVGTMSLYLGYTERTVSEKVLLNKPPAKHYTYQRFQLGS